MYDFLFTTFIQCIHSLASQLVHMYIESSAKRLILKTSFLTTPNKICQKEYTRYIWSQLLWYLWKRLSHGSRHCITSGNIVGSPDCLCIILLFLLVHLWLFFIDASIICEGIIISFVVVIGVIGPLLCLHW